MTAVDIGGMADMAEGSWTPDGPQDLMAKLESLPHLFEMVSAGMHELGGFMSGQGGILEDQGAAMEDAAGTAGELFERMSDIFLAVNEHAAFWTGGG